MFTLADAALLRPLQVRDPGRLVVWSWTSSYPDYKEYARRTDLFEGVAGVGSGSRLNLVIGDRAELAPAVFFTGNAFDVLGVRPAFGRLIIPSDDVANRPLVEVLGYDYGRSRFGGDPSVVGRTFRANGRPLTIIGIAEKGFRGTSRAANPSPYVPTAAFSQVTTGFFSRLNALEAKGFVWLTVIARMRPDVATAHAATTMSGVYLQLHPRDPGQKPDVLQLEPLPTRALGRGAADVRTFVNTPPRGSWV